MTGTQAILTLEEFHMATIEPQPYENQTQNRANILVGILLLIPAVLACGASQLLFSAGTLITSLQKSNLFGTAEFIGLANYAHFFDDKALSQAFGFTAQAVLVNLLVVAIVPLLLAWGASLLGRAPRVMLRVLFTFPVVAFVPVAIALMWSLALNPYNGLLGQPVLGRPDQARQALFLIDGLYAFGLACALGLVFYLAALRSPDAGQNPWKSLRVTWGIGLLAAAAATLQSFTLSYVLTAGGPVGATTSLLLYLYKTSFQFMAFGYGSAIATLILVILGLLGLVAGAMLVASNLKIRLVPRAESATPAPERDGKTVAVLALIVALLIALAAGIVSLLPFILTITTAMKSENPAQLQKIIPLASTLVNTILPPLIAVLLVQTPIAYLGALGIGALRPLGRHSEWLLLPFCPWLFVGLAPLSLYAFQVAQKMGFLNSFVGLIPPSAVSIPMLVILTLFFKGQQTQFRQAQAAGASAGRAFFTKFIRPSLPLAAILACAALFGSLQDPFWSMIVANKSALYPLNNFLITMQAMYAAQPALIANAVLWAVLPGSLFFFVVFASFQIFYLDRLSSSTGSD